MPSEVRFAEVRKVLIKHGWQIRVKGSHHIFFGPGRRLLSIPVHKGRVKAIYARQAEAAIRALEEQKKVEQEED